VMIRDRSIRNRELRTLVWPVDSWPCRLVYSSARSEQIKLYCGEGTRSGGEDLAGRPPRVPDDLNAHCAGYLQNQKRNFGPRWTTPAGSLSPRLTFSERLHPQRDAQVISFLEQLARLARSAG